MNPDLILYVVLRHDDVNHLCRRGRANALCGTWLGNEYIVMKPLLRPDVEHPTCVACVARAA